MKWWFRPGPTSKERGNEYDCICRSSFRKQRRIPRHMSIYSNSHLNKLIPTWSAATLPVFPFPSPDLLPLSQFIPIPSSTIHPINFQNPVSFFFHSNVLKIRLASNPFPHGRSPSYHQPGSPSVHSSTRTKVHFLHTTKCLTETEIILWDPRPPFYLLCDKRPPPSPAYKNSRNHHQRDKIIIIKWNAFVTRDYELSL